MIEELLKVDSHILEYEDLQWGRETTEIKSWHLPLPNVDALFIILFMT